MESTLAPSRGRAAAEANGSAAIPVTVTDLELALKLARELQAGGRPRAVRADGLIGLFGGGAVTQEHLARVREALAAAGVSATVSSDEVETSTVVLALAEGGGERSRGTGGSGRLARGRREEVRGERPGDG
nr:hypothetical protein [Actinomycetota bacterium]